MFNLKRYSKDEKKVWDRFIDEARNSTFLFKRDYMDYHSDRFTDHSLIIQYKNQTAAVFCANQVEDKIFSHLGLTYGGLIYNQNITTSLALKTFELILEYYAEHNIKSILYKCVPHIYHKRASEEDLFCLFQNNATLYARSPSSVIDFKYTKQLPGKKGNGARKASRLGLSFSQVEDPGRIIQMVDENLKSRYGINSVHNIEEMRLLSKSFPNNIEIFEIKNSLEKIIGGAIVYLANSVAHLQYSVINSEGRPLRGMDLLISELFKRYSKTFSYFDFGISSEKNGRILNQSLISQKEDYAATTINYDQYLIKI